MNKSPAPLSRKVNEHCQDCRRTTNLLSMALTYINELITKYEGGSTVGIRMFNAQLESEYLRQGFYQPNEAEKRRAKTPSVSIKPGSISPTKDQTQGPQPQKVPPKKLKNITLTKDIHGNPIDPILIGLQKNKLAEAEDIKIDGLPEKDYVTHIEPISDEATRFYVSTSQSCGPVTYNHSLRLNHRPTAYILCVKSLNGFEFVFSRNYPVAVFKGEEKVFEGNFNMKPWCTYGTITEKEGKETITRPENYRNTSKAVHSTGQAIFYVTAENGMVRIAGNVPFLESEITAVRGLEIEDFFLDGEKLTVLTKAGEIRDLSNNKTVKITNDDVVADYWCCIIKLGMKSVVSGWNKEQKTNYFCLLGVDFSVVHWMKIKSSSWNPTMRLMPIVRRNTQFIIGARDFSFLDLIALVKDKLYDLGAKDVTSGQGWEYICTLAESEGEVLVGTKGMVKRIGLK